MATASVDPKVLRGTKRVCQSCEVRFYDLMREQIVCPACGAAHTIVAQPAAQEGRRSGAGFAKAGWRQRPRPVLPEPDPQRAVAAEEAEVTAEATADEVPVADAEPEDDSVLEPEADDGDVSGLVDVDIEEPKEP